MSKCLAHDALLDNATVGPLTSVKVEGTEMAAVNGVCDCVVDSDFADPMYYKDGVCDGRAGTFSMQRGKSWVLPKQL